MYELQASKRKDAEDEIEMIFSVNESIPAVIMQVWLDNGTRIKTELHKPYVGLYRSYFMSDVFKKKCTNSSARKEG